MDALMIPLVPAQQKVSPLEVKNQGRPEPVSKFSRYMEKKMANERQEKNNLLGANRANAKAHSSSAEGRNEARQAAKEDGQDASNIAALLAQFVAELKNAATADGDSGPGEWSFSVPDAALIQKIAADAGMSDAELAVLMEKMKNQDGAFSLVDFLDTFARHFESLSDTNPVSAPETDLPLLQIILERLGASATEVAKVGESAVRGDNSLDLEKLLAGLQDLQGEGTTTLTQVEAEQLQEMLAGAGVSEPMQRSLLPELVPSWLDAEAEGLPVTMSLERLQNLLNQAVKDVKANRLQADLPSFLADLQEVLNQSGFAAKDMGWTPAVQEAVVSVFEKLLESVDLAQVKLRQGNQFAQQEKNSDLEADAEGETWEEVLSGLDEAESLLGDETKKDAALAGEKNAGPDGKYDSAAFAADSMGEEGGVLHSGAAATAKNEAGGASGAAAQVSRPFVHIANLPPGLQQDTFAQLSQGVLQGLRNNEHHLVMKLYPKELGEVRVELMVRDEQVAVSFAMENSKVKEVLEKNMEQFKENMEKQGFVLGECMVSVNNQNEGNEAWQQFQASWREQGVGLRKVSHPAALPEDVLYQSGSGRSLNENGVDLFA
ncbi:flagellar hook-length control protein FliK [Thiovibrio sp. JS02]